MANALMVLAYVLWLTVPEASAAARDVREFSVGVAVDIPDFDLVWNVTALNLTGTIDYANSTGYVQTKAIMRLNPSSILGARFDWRVLHDGVPIPNCEGSVLRAAGEGNEIPYVELDCPFTPHAGVNTLTFDQTTNSNVLFVRGSITAFEVHIVVLSDTLTLETTLDAWIPYLVAGALALVGLARRQMVFVAVAALFALGTAAGNGWSPAALAVFAITAFILVAIVEQVRSRRKTESD